MNRDPYVPHCHIISGKTSDRHVAEPLSNLVFDAESLRRILLDTKRKFDSVPTR